jgi:copper chaperone CopZ
VHHHIRPTKHITMKTVILFVSLFLSFTSNAQVTKVSLQASGLTCSMCSNAVHKALKTLDFVDQIDADIKTYTFNISFKANHVVDFDLIKKKVEDAGFSVSQFIATALFNNVQLNKTEPVEIEGKKFIFLNAPGQSLTGAFKIKLINKGFVSSKEYKSYASNTFDTGSYHALINNLP